MTRYRIPFSPDRPGSRYKARVQFVRSIIGEGAGGTLYTTPGGSLAIEFDNVLDIRVHTIHDRSERFGADVRQCSICHLTPPSGPARGLLP